VDPGRHVRVPKHSWSASRPSALIG
jgi:hypothetical protein